MTYISIYTDAEGTKYVGEQWETSDEDHFEDQVAAEEKVISEVPGLQSVTICEVKFTVNKVEE